MFNFIVSNIEIRRKQHALDEKLRVLFRRSGLFVYLVGDIDRKIVNLSVYSQGSDFCLFYGFLFQDKHANLKTPLNAELIYRLFMQKKKELFNDINGIFLCVIYDKSEQEVIIANDKMGLKTVYFYHSNKKVIVSNNLFFLKQYVETNISSENVRKFVEAGFVSGYNTLFNQILRMPPASVFSMSRFNFLRRKYWRLLSGVYINNEDFAYNQLKEVFFSLTVSLKRIFESRKYTIFYSGGLDSSYLIDLAARFDVRPRSLYIQMGGNSNKINDTRGILSNYKCDHRNIRISFDDFARCCLTVSSCLDEPIDDSGLICTYYALSRIRRDSQYVFTGMGLDELFLGSPAQIMKDYFNEKQHYSLKTGVLIKERLLGFSYEILMNHSLYSYFSHNKISNMFGIEYIPVYLYPPLSRLAFNLSVSLKVKEGQTKYLFRRFVRQTSISGINFKERQSTKIPKHWEEDVARRYYKIINKKPYKNIAGLNYKIIWRIVLFNLWYEKYKSVCKYPL